jgi:hypothetical protein
MPRQSAIRGGAILQAHPRTFKPPRD